MARMSGKVTREFDAAAAVTLRNAADGAETADVAEAGVALNTLTGAEWDNGEVPNGIIMVGVHVTDINFADTDEVYDLYFEVDTTSGFASAVEVARLKGVPAVGFYEVPISSKAIEKLEPGATHLRVRLDGTGTSFTITYGAWMTFLTH